MFVYIAADNNLYRNAIKNINDMERAKRDDINIIVYLDSLEGHSVVYEIIQDESKDIKSKIIASYDKDNSSDYKTLEKFLKICFEKYNAKETGIVLWSHGSGFLPPDYESSYNNPKKDVMFSFGLDNENRMDIKDMALVLNKYKSDYIIFDACYMADIETVYEIKDAAKYIIASQTEILGEGYPYSNVIYTLRKNLELEEKLKNVCEDFYKYYNEKNNDIQKSASVSLIETSKIESFENSFRIFYKEVKNKYGAETFIKYLNLVQKSSDNLIYMNNKYDIKDWALKIKEYSGFTESFDNFIDSFESLVIYEKNTKYMFSSFSILNCKGLNFYIPYDRNDRIYEYYTNTLWAKRTKFYENF